MKKELKNEIHLAIAFDQNYLSPFYALLTSIFENNNCINLVIHTIVSGVSDRAKDNIQIYAQENNCTIHFYSVNEDEVSRFVLTSKWTSAVYYRLFFPLLLPLSVERLLYLDTDTLVLGNLTFLYYADLEGFPVGAVYDNWVKVAPHLDINEAGNYFNSGVLLIDVPKWKEERVSENSFAFLNMYPEKIKFVDQDALNAVLKNNWKKLDNRFNLMYSLIPEATSIAKLKDTLRGVVVLHFTLSRPWQLLCKNRFRYLYFYYLRKSPYKPSKIIVDFSWSKIPDLIKIRITEFYHDAPVLQLIYKKLKGLVV